METVFLAGSGTLSYQADKKIKNVGLRRGDVFRLESGTVFFLQSDLDTEAGRERLRIHAIFGDAGEDFRVRNSEHHLLILCLDRQVFENVIGLAMKLLFQFLNFRIQFNMDHIQA